jgi:Icc-related predicted phosphoesterase
MRIQIASDLHLEYLEKHFPGYHGVVPCDVDLLVLAGDIAQGTRVFDIFAGWPIPILFVPGNHEFDGSSVAEVLREFEERQPRYPGIKVLSQGVLHAMGVRFIGCTLWTDFAVLGEARIEEVMQACAENVPDFTAIKGDDGGKFTPAASLGLHRQQRAWLQGVLDEPFEGKTVLITHHAPHPDSADPRYGAHPTTAAFVSDLGPLLERVDVVIHGHLHVSSDYTLGNTRVIANPKGYSKGIKSSRTQFELKHENELFDPKLVIDLHAKSAVTLSML